METTGERIREKRKAKGLGLAALADAAGMTSQNLWNLENGMVGKTFEKLAPLAKALECRIDDLFPEMDEFKTDSAVGFDDSLDDLDL